MKVYDVTPEIIAINKLVDSLVASDIPAECFGVNECPKQKETDMQYTIENTNINSTDREAKQRLRNRVREIYCSHQDKLDKKFHILDDPRPCSIKEIAERIEKGLFTFSWDPDEQPERPTAETKFEHWYDMMDSLTWRNPEDKKDEKGREKAGNDLDIAFQKTLDEIFCLTPEEGLKSLNKFATLH